MPRGAPVGYRCPELTDHQLRARAFEAIRLRLDQTAAWPDLRCWPAIARALGYPSGDAAKRATYRTLTAVKYRQSAEMYRQFLLLAKAVRLPPDAQHISAILRELDEQQAPQDADPPKPKKKRVPSRMTLARAIQKEILLRRNAVEADPDPQAIIVAGRTPMSRDTSYCRTPHI